jgi:hypothetical protein
MDTGAEHALPTCPDLAHESPPATGPTHTGRTHRASLDVSALPAPASARFAGVFAGYVSARLYKLFRGNDWKRNPLKTATMFPGIVGARARAQRLAG